MRRSPFQFKSIRTKIAVTFSALILCTVLALSLNTYLITSGAVKENSIEYTSQLIQQINKNIQTYVGNTTSISEFVLNDDDLQQLMNLPDPHADEGKRLVLSTESFFHSIVASRDDIASIVFIGSNGALVSDGNLSKLKPYSELISQEWYQSAQAANGEVVISSSRVQHIYKGEYRWVVSISRQTTGGIGNSGNGVLLVDLNYKVINDLGLQIEMASHGYVFILDHEGNIVFHPQQQLIYSGLKSEEIAMILSSGDRSFETQSEGTDKIYTVRTTEFGWKVIGVNYPGELVGNKTQIQLTSLFWGGIALLCVLAISVLLSMALTKPIKNLEVQMKKVEKGDFDTRAEIESVNEIGKLARTFNLMTGRIKELLEQVVQEQEEKRVSELKALQAQIRPHFLYNTLDSIIWMAEMGKQSEVVDMTSALAKLLRYSISKGDELVPIQEELAHAENYLTIQSIRYRSQFSYSIEVEPGLYHCKIIKIVLQPLLENAIYHGIKNQLDGGHINISVRRREGFVELQVSDDGIGITPQRLAELQQLGATAETQGGMGLLNVNYRLRLNFGGHCGLFFESELDEGTTVTVRIPEIG